MRLFDALAMTLAGWSLSLALPAKLGDVAKCVFIAQKQNLPISYSLFVTIFEKAADLVALVFIGGLCLYFSDPQNALIGNIRYAFLVFPLVGAILLFSKTVNEKTFRGVERLLPGVVMRKLGKSTGLWCDLVEEVSSVRNVRAQITGYSLAIWLLHLSQIWLFVTALGGSITPTESFGLSMLAIVAGLLPITFAGIGVRDAVVVSIFSPFLNLEASIALGLLMTGRYVVPALMGWPFLTICTAASKTPAQIEPVD